MILNLLNNRAAVTGYDAFAGHAKSTSVLTEDPLMTIRVEDKKVDLTAFVVIHNLGDHGACGGIRCVPDIDEDEVKALARAMAYKYAFFEKSHGGGKGGIVMDYDTPPERRRELASCLGAHLKPLLVSGMYHAWTDMNFSVDDASALYAGAGLVGGIVKGESSRRTALSTLASVAASAEFLGIATEKCRVAIEGLGSVGGILAEELERRGSRIVAVSNRLGAIANDDGIPVETMLKLREEKGAGFVLERGPWHNSSREGLFEVEADILVPCARVESIDEGVARRTPVRAIVPAANVPHTTVAERILEERGILALPGFIVNAGGILGFIGEAENECLVFVNKFKDMVGRLLTLSAELHMSPSACARRAAEQKAASRRQNFFKSESLSTKAVSYLRGKGLFPKASPRKAQRVQQLFELLDTSFRA